MITFSAPHPMPVQFAGRKKTGKSAPSTPVNNPPAPPVDSAPGPTPTQAPAIKKAGKAPKVTGPKPTPFDNLKIKDTEVIVFDIETTGLLARAEKPGDPVPEGGYDDLTEMSAIKYKNGKEISRFYALVKPKKPIPNEVEEKTNITNKLVNKKGKPTEEVLPKFFEYIGENPILIGHNAKWFDTKFVRAICERYGRMDLKEKLVYEHVIDTKIIAQRLFPDCVWTYDKDGKGIPPTPGPNSPENLQLSTLAKFFGFDTSGAHRAENDVGMAAKIFYKMVETVNSKGTPMETFGDVYKYQIKPKKTS